MNIVNRRAQVLFVADKAIPNFTHPKWLPGNAKPQSGIIRHCPASAKRFPRLHNFRQRLLLQDEHMHMIRHDAPCQEAIPGTIRMKERVFKHGGKRRMSQGATTHACVKPFFDFDTTLNIPFFFWQSGKLFFELMELFLGKGISKAKGNGLEQAEFVTMRKIAARIPSGSTGNAGSAKLQLGICFFGRFLPSWSLAFPEGRRFTVHASDAAGQSEGGGMCILVRLIPKPAKRKRRGCRIWVSRSMIVSVTTRLQHNMRGGAFNKDTKP